MEPTVEKASETTQSDSENGRQDDARKKSEVREYPHGIPLAFLIVALVLDMFMLSLEQTIVATAIPKITDQFHGLDLVTWYGAAFFMAMAAFLGVWGKAYKLFPLKPTFLLGLLIFEVGCVICGAAPSAGALIGGRAISGAGAAAMITGCYTIVGLAAPPRESAQYTGIVGAAYGLGSVTGPLLGGVFADKATWRWVFYINLPIGAVTAVMVLFFLKLRGPNSDTKLSLWSKIGHLDLGGAVLLVGAIVCYLLALQKGGQTDPWSSSVVIGLLVGFAAMLVAFGALEYLQGDRAMISATLVKQRAFYVSACMTLLFAGSFFAVLYYLPIYFQSVKGVSAIASGVRTLPFILSLTAGTVLAGGLITRTGHAVPIMVLGASLATVGYGLLYLLDAHSSTGEWIGFQIVGGLGTGLAYQVPLNIAQASVESSDMSLINSMILLFTVGGGSLFVSAGQSVFVNILLETLRSSAPDIDPVLVLATGSTQIRSAFPPELVGHVVEAYMSGLRATFAMAIAGAGLATLVSVASRWKRIGAASPTQ